MVPNYSGRLLDKMILVAAKQTSAVRPNPDDPEYVRVRVKVIRKLSRALWKLREELQEERRKKQRSPSTPTTPAA